MLYSVFLIIITLLKVGKLPHFGVGGYTIYTYILRLQHKISSNRACSPHTFLEGEISARVIINDLFIMLGLRVWG